MLPTRLNAHFVSVVASSWRSSFNFRPLRARNVSGPDIAGFPAIRFHCGWRRISDLFKKYGLGLEPVLFRGGTESASALAGGEIQFDVVAPQPHIAASLSGADIIIIGTYFNKHTYSIVARPGIRSPQELKGKRIGVLS